MVADTEPSSVTRGEIPGVTAFAFARLLNPAPDAASLALTRDGHLMVTVSGEIMARTDDLLLCSENLDARPLNRRMQGRAVPEVFQRLVSLEGQGHMVLSRARENFYPLKLQRDLCFFVERFIWALEASLMWDVGRLPGTRLTTPIPLVRVAGEGAVALRIRGELVAVKVSPNRPYRVRDEGFVGWVGNVVPQVLPKVEGAADTSFLLCEGEGAVLVSLPGSDGRDGGFAAS
ncbi:MAG: hypothetical protein ACE37F_18335 [Nannocystaceae bacterium]|nr:hypothetical protein [bacterium]